MQFKTTIRTRNIGSFKTSFWVPWIFWTINFLLELSLSYQRSGLSYRGYIPVFVIFSYIMNKLSTKKCHLLAVLMNYVKMHSKPIQWIKKSPSHQRKKNFVILNLRKEQYLYKVAMSTHLCRLKLVCTYSVYDIILDAFLKPNHVLAPFLQYSTLWNG